MLWGNLGQGPEFDLLHQIGSMSRLLQYDQPHVVDNLHMYIVNIGSVLKSMISFSLLRFLAIYISSFTFAVSCNNTTYTIYSLSCDTVLASYRTFQNLRKQEFKNSPARSSVKQQQRTRAKFEKSLKNRTDPVITIQASPIVCVEMQL